MPLSVGSCIEQWLPTRSQDSSRWSATTAWGAGGEVNGERHPSPDPAAGPVRYLTEQVLPGSTDRLRKLAALDYAGTWRY